MENRNLNLNLRGEKFETIETVEGLVFKIQAGGHMIFDGPPGRTDNVQITLMASGKGTVKLESSEVAVFTENWIPVSAVIPSKKDFTVSVSGDDPEDAVRIKTFSYKELGLFKESQKAATPMEGTASKFKLYVNTAEPEIISGLRAALVRYGEVMGVEISLVPENFDTEIEDVRLVSFLRAAIQQTLGLSLGS